MGENPSLCGLMISVLPVHRRGRSLQFDARWPSQSRTPSGTGPCLKTKQDDSNMICAFTSRRSTVLMQHEVVGSAVELLITERARVLVLCGAII